MASRLINLPSSARPISPQPPYVMHLPRLEKMDLRTVMGLIVPFIIPDTAWAGIPASTWQGAIVVIVVVVNQSAS